MGWYYYLQVNLSLPGQMPLDRMTSLLTTGEHVEVLRMAPEDACMKDMRVLVRWQGPNFAVHFSTQPDVIDPDDSTNEAVGDWHYWVAYGY